jgi:hypothetical protein
LRARKPLAEGQRYGRLTVIREDGYPAYLCRCDCGNLVRVVAHNLRGGNTKSCGCLKREKLYRGTRTPFAPKAA